MTGRASRVTVREYVPQETAEEGGIGDWRNDLRAEFYHDDQYAPCEPHNPAEIEALCWWRAAPGEMAAD